MDARTAVCEIARGASTYVTGPDAWVRSRVTTMTGLGGDYLYANWDGTGRNNLHALSTLEAIRPAAVREAATGSLWSRVRRLVRRGA